MVVPIPSSFQRVLPQAIILNIFVYHICSRMGRPTIFPELWRQRSGVDQCENKGQVSRATPCYEGEMPRGSIGRTVEDTT